MENKVNKIEAKKDGLIQINQGKTNMAYDSIDLTQISEQVIDLPDPDI